MLREFRSKAKGTSDLLNYGSLIDEGIILLKDGAFLSGWIYRGPDLNSSGNIELEQLSARVNNTLCKFGDGWMIHADVFRKTSQEYPSPERSFFPDPVSRMIDEERRIQHEAEGAHFESEYHIFVTYLPPSEIESKVTRLFIEGDTKNSLSWNRILNTYKEAIDDVENQLKGFLYVEKINSNKLLTLLHRDVTGLTHPVVMPKIPVYLDYLLGSQDFVPGLTPKIGGKHIRVISIEGFPMESYPGMLQFLDKLPIQFRFSNRFIFLDPQSALSELKKYRRNWFQKRQGLLGLISEVITGNANMANKNEDALEMTSDVEGAKKETESGLVKYGYYTSVIVIHDEDDEAIKDSCKIFLQYLNNNGYTARVETVNAVEAFLGSLPGHGYQNVRRPLINTLNIADLIPFTGIWAGLEYNPCKYYPKNSPPLLYAATDGTTPFRLNLHVKTSGHSGIFGATGEGKSVLLTTIISQFFRYPDAQVFYFDKGYSAYILCKAMGGTHYDVMGNKNSPAFYPLANIHEPNELNWACEWIEECLLLSKFPLTNHHRNAIREGLIRLSHSESRTITELQSAIQDREIKEALEFYTLGGEMGSVLDASQDDLRSGRLQVFEMDHLLSKGISRFLPTVLYIFRQIEKRMNVNRPTLICIEEGHNFLHGKFGQQIEKWLLEIRKKNGTVIFLTQDVSHVLNSEIKENFFNSCKTNFFLPNVKANDDYNYKNYRKVGLSDKQIDILANAISNRHYYVTSPLGNRLIDLGLGELALSFCGVDSSEDRKKVNDLIQQHSDQWVYHWLKERGLDDWADYWHSLHHEYKNAQIGK